jgi:AmmeMemoRadiSam system protein B
MSIRPAAVAGTWYPGTAGALAREIDEYVAAAPEAPEGQVRALIAPHAGLMFSGHVAAHAYKAAARGTYDVAVLAGPSHFVGFEGVAIYPEGGFASPLGEAKIDAEVASALTRFDVVHPMPSAHGREHSLEMQLPFLRRLMPDVPIVPMLMGYQLPETIVRLAEALTGALSGRRALIVASTDLSHYFDARTAATLDARVQACVGAFDPDQLLKLFEQYPEMERGRYVACGGGPAIAVMFAARNLGASSARVLKYAHSGEISGDDGAVVGYLAAVMGDFQ